MYPPGDQDKVQKAFFACTPFNIMLAQYFVEVKKDYALFNYLNDTAKNLLEETNITPQTIINQIEDQYQKYLVEKTLEISEDN